MSPHFLKWFDGCWKCAQTFDLNFIAALWSNPCLWVMTCFFFFSAGSIFIKSLTEASVPLVEILKNDSSLGLWTEPTPVLVADNGFMAWWCQDLRWALSVVKTRGFAFEGTRESTMLIPLADFLNHNMATTLGETCICVHGIFAVLFQSTICFWLNPLTSRNVSHKSLEISWNRGGQCANCDTCRGHPTFAKLKVPPVPQVPQVPQVPLPGEVSQT